jgi:glycosyltransferase involved in cell wall biosynthesis
MSPSREIQPDSTPEAIVFWPWAADESARETVRSALRTLPAGTRLRLPANDAGRALAEALTPAERDRLTPVEATELPGFLETVAGTSARADLVLLAAAGELPTGWLERLRRAAAGDDELAGATALVGDGDGQTGGHRNVPASDLPGAALARVLVPRLHCSLLRRPALDLTGPLDPSLTHPAALLEGFAASALEHGLSFALAADVVVEPRPGGPGTLPPDQAARTAGAHPWLQAALAAEADDAGPLRAALVRSWAARHGLSVTIDARTLGHVVGGTPTYVEGLVMALARRGEVAVRAVLHDAPESVMTAFAEAGVETITYHEGAAGAPRTGVIHRPQQIFTTADLRLAWLLGERLVISQMDLISYRTPSYHSTVEQWQAYRRTTRLALSSADRVIFFSQHGRRSAIDECLVAADRASVAGIGVAPAPPGLPRERPARLPDRRGLLLMLGSDYTHKNRPFAMRLADELRRRHGWEGMLVLAGPHVEYGSSREAEQAILRERPDLAVHLVDLGPVSEAEKQWLLDNADAHVCASNYEGFGLAPLEAAAAGRPCIFAPCTSLGEVIGSAAATIVPWDPAASADAAMPLLEPGQARDRHVSLLAAALERYRWDDVARELCGIYADAVASPYAAPRSWDELKREDLIVSLDAARSDIQNRTAYGMALVDSRDPLLSRAQQRGLMRVAARRWLRAPLLAPFGLLGADEPDSDTRPAK